MTEAKSTIENITNQAKAKSRRRDFDISAIGEGEQAWQGDVSLTLLGMEKPVDADLTKVKAEGGPDYQVAVGTGVGSRHTIKHSTVDIYTLEGANQLQGPILHCLENTTLEHPEHGNITGLQQGAWYSVNYQRQMAEELRRAQD